MDEVREELIARLWEEIPRNDLLKEKVAQAYISYRQNTSISWYEAMEYALILYRLLDMPTSLPTVSGAEEYEDILKAQATMDETSADWS